MVIVFDVRFVLWFELNKDEEELSKMDALNCQDLPELEVVEDSRFYLWSIRPLYGFPKNSFKIYRSLAI